MLDQKLWTPLNNDSSGYVGKHRNEEWAKRDTKFGKDNWRMSWFVEGEYLEYEEACRHYEQAYFVYFQQRPELLQHLIETASDVFDDDPSNTTSGVNYLKRGEVRTHIQDIAIRNCLQRLGKKFKGSTLLQIRDRLGSHPLSLALSPGQVPFHKPTWLSEPDNLQAVEQNAWWLPGSVEDWYQRAKRLCIRSATL